MIAAFEDGEIVRYNGDYRFYMDKNEALRNKVTAPPRTPLCQPSPFTPSPLTLRGVGSSVHGLG